MENNASTKSITISVVIALPIEIVWRYWTEPQHITQWCQASDDWHAPFADNNLIEGGVFTTTMAAKDGSVSFDFSGVYTKIVMHNLIAYRLGDGRLVSIVFLNNGSETTITETFEPESENPLDMQEAGWQAILNSFKQYAEQQ
jgi:uncharacterized protein YndB with AHSA1/START domain